MTKLLNNKTLRTVLAIIMAVLLVVSLIPAIQPAYGSDSERTPTAGTIFENISDAPMNDTSGNEPPQGTEGEGSEEMSPDEPANDPDFEENEGFEGPEFGDPEFSEPGDEFVSSDFMAPEDMPEVTPEEEGPSEDEGNTDESDEDETESLALSGTMDIKEDITIKEGDTQTANLRYTDGKTYTLTIDGVLNGTIYVSKGTTLNLEGSGLINGNGAPTVIHVEGDNSVLNVNADGGCIEITGGAGGTKLNDKKNFPDYSSGGGILVERSNVPSNGDGGVGATLNLYNGWIHDNWAGSGGGIHIDRGCSFYMAAGTVSENNTKAVPKTITGDKDYPAHEAGGIYVAGSSANSSDYASTEHAFIEGGLIANNHTNTTIDWGGGGIFVESRGVLRIGTASITGNFADGLGGGVSGCPHASIGVGDITEGAAIWGNTAYKLRKPFNSYLTVSQIQDGHRYGDMYAYGLYKSDFKDGELVKDGQGVLYRKGLYDSDKGLGSFIDKDYSKSEFTADFAHDYYCTKVSAIMGPNVGVSLENNEVWKGYAANDQGGSDFTIKKGEVQAFSVGSVGLTSLLPKNFNPGDRSLTISGNTSTTHGGGIGCNGKLIMGTLPSGESYGDLSLEFNKQLVNSLGETLNLDGYSFDFELTDKNSGKVYTATTDTNGAFTFNLSGEDYLIGTTDGQTTTVEFELREVSNRAYPDVVFDPNGYTVNLSFTTSVHEAGIVGSANVTSYTFSNPVYTVNGVSSTEFVVTNMLQLYGAWTPQAKKFYHGDTGVAGAYNFELVEIEAPQGNFADIAIKEGGEVREATNGDFTEADGSAWVLFDDIFYTEAGEHWYRIRETNGNDPVVYVLKVVVDGENVGTGEVSSVLVPQVVEVYYADSLESETFTKLEGDLATIEFHNNGLADYRISGYAVNALTGAPLTQKCLVDPKIIKELEGRTLTPGEFSFQLIEVNDYTDTTGKVISETSNDEFGMVDFDKAANKADPGWAPSCLLFTQPGTYKYRVIEDPNQAADPSVDYSDQIITFTVVVDLDPETGILAASDMYYGYVNEDGENVRYKEQYDGWETKGEDWEPAAGDYADYNPEWHPTMVNVAKPMDLAVRKTSALTGEGLEGATYALYMVNNGDEADIKLGSSSSDTDGWIYFEDVALKEGNLYYFLEEAAPEGHTVSKFRSKYFYLTPDATAANGFVLNYTDNKSVLGEPSDPETEPVMLFAEDASDSLSAATVPTTGKDGAMLYTYAADGGVQDEATYVEFNKLDTKNHEWVEGAKLSIIEKETGLVVNSWVSGKAPEVLQKTLNVGVVYILRETEAPEGYEKASDVEFSIGQYGEIEIISGTSNGNAELSGSTITLYDTRIPIEEVIIQERETVREVPGENKVENVIERGEDTVQTVASDIRDVPKETHLAQTGDVWLMIALGLLTVVGASALGIVLLRRRREH